MKNKMYRQGDVLIERVSALPKDIKPVSRENGRIILAHGEVTGHAHAFVDDKSAKFIDANGAEFFNIRGPKLKCKLPVLRAWRNQVMVRHPEHGLIEFSRADIEVIGDNAVIEGEFGLLKHDEHNTHGIPAGYYRGGGADKKVYQREYTPQELRRVAD